MIDPISIALVGIGGYGNNFVNGLLDAPKDRIFRFAGTIDPSPATCRRIPELQAKKIPHFASLDAFYAKDRADLVVVSSPIHLHALHTCYAMAHGSNVLCEKPLCATVQHAREMRHLRDRLNKIVGVGYQWSFSYAIQRLKADVKSGALGKPKRLKCLVLWPRDEAYYTRNKWAGAKQDPNGNVVLDSPVNNACAHYLHNMLYILGPRVDRSATPARVTAELYRANNITNFDTGVLRCETSEGVEILFAVSHATEKNHGPIFEYEFENAKVVFTDQPESTIVATLNDGSTRDYGSPNEVRTSKLWQTADAVRTRAHVTCGIEASFAHTQCVLAAQESCPEIATFPTDLIRVSGEPGHRKTSVNGLADALVQCYESGKLPSELGLPWARPGKQIDVTTQL